MILYIANIILAITGLYVVFGIRRKKQTKKESGLMVCALGSNCQHVLFSKYSKIFGIDIEKIGFLYYIFIILGYVALLAVLNSTTISLGLLHFALLIASISGFLFSCYLIFVQGVLIKSWCPWCVSSSVLSTLIFILSSLSFAAALDGGLNIAEILFANLTLILIIRLIALSIGISSVIISTIMVIRFLRDFRIDEQEDRKINMVNQINWASMLLLILANVSIYIINPMIYSNSAEWVTQLFILAVLILNTAIFDLHIQPNLIGLRLDLSSINVFRTFWLRQNAFSSITISVVSWISIAFVSAFKESSSAGADLVAINTTDDAVLMISYYISVVVIAVIVSQILTFLIDKAKVVTKRKTIPINLNQ